MPRSAKAPRRGLDPAFGRELSKLTHLAWPIATAQVAQLGLNTTDVMMIGWLGPEPLAAAALAMLLISQFLLFVVGLASAAAPLAAAALAQCDARGLRRAVRQSLWAVALFSLPLTLVYLFGLTPFLLAIGQDPALVALAQHYADGAAWSIGLSGLYVVLRGFENAFEITKPVLILSIAALPVNAALNYVLIFGGFGLPRLELFGAGLGTTITTLAMLIALGVHASMAKKLRRLVIFGRFWRPDWPMLGRVVGLGAPIGASIVVETGMFAFGGLVMGYFGALNLAGHQIALQLASVTFMAPLGVSQAVTVRVGRHFGKRDLDACRRAAIAGVVLTLGCMAISATAFWTIPELLAQPFLDGGPDSAELAAIAAGFLLIAGGFQLVDGLQVSIMGALRGLQDTKTPLLLAAASYWCVGAPAIVLLAFFTPLEGFGVWFGYALALAAASALLGRRLWAATETRAPKKPRRSAQ